MTEAAAIVGPPWRQVPREAAKLAIDAPPASVACEAWAVGCPELGELRRARSAQHAGRLAKRMAERTGTEALVLHGALQTTGGTWIWPVVKGRVGVAKQNPLTAGGFNAILEQRKRGLMRAVRAAERRAERESRRDLRRDWARLVPRVARRTLDRIEGRIARVPRQQGVRNAMRVLTDRAEQVAVRASQRRMTGRDRRRARRAARMQLQRMRAEYQMRAERFRAEAEGVIARARSGDITSREARRQLRQTLARNLKSRTSWYVDIVVSAVIGRARSRGQVERLRREGASSYVWRARGGPFAFHPTVCDVCRFLDGTVFPVDAAAEQMRAMERSTDPDVALPVAAWYKVQGGQIVVGTGRRGGGSRATVATVSQTGVGTSQAGLYRQVNDPKATGGTMTPPAHGHCQCMLVPADESG